VDHQDSPTAGRAIAEQVLASFASCPIPEVARLGRTPKQWREAFLGYFTTGGANNGGTEAINGLIELHRRVSVNRPSGWRHAMGLLVHVGGPGR
jgi:transposase